MGNKLLKRKMVKHNNSFPENNQCECSTYCIQGLHLHSTINALLGSVLIKN